MNLLLISPAITLMHFFPVFFYPFPKIITITTKSYFFTLYSLFNRNAPSINFYIQILVTKIFFIFNVSTILSAEKPKPKSPNIKSITSCPFTMNFLLPFFCPFTSLIIYCSVWILEITKSIILLAVSPPNSITTHQYGILTI
jgi:hypothetical protein